LALKKYNYGKQIAAIEKLIFPSPEQPSRAQHHSTYSGPAMNMGPSEVSKTLPLDINSTAPTPMLTMEQNSPQSSSLPSTNVSTVDDGPADLVGAHKQIGVNTTPEVRIEAV